MDDSLHEPKPNTESMSKTRPQRTFAADFSSDELRDSSGELRGGQADPCPSSSSPVLHGPQLFYPSRYEKNYSYPLLIWLSAERITMQTLAQKVASVSTQNFVAVGTVATAKTVGALPNDSQAVHNLIDDAVYFAQKRANIHANRIFVVSDNLSVDSLLEYALSSNISLAGLISINGQMSERCLSLSGSNRIAELELLLLSDDLIALHSEQAEIVREHLTDLGMPLFVREYLASDRSRFHMHQDINRWVMEKVTGESLLRNSLAVDIWAAQLN